MGGVIDSGGGIGIKLSPRRVAIEKAQEELKQEYDVREERKRELEFLEKGGNPLDFKFGNATSHSVQSTPLIDKQADHFVKSEVKDSFPLTASVHGDSVESNGRPGVSIVSEPNTADNLLLFDAENKSLEGERNSKYLNKRSRTSEPERSFKTNNFQNTKETEDSAIFRPYARRNRSKINRDPARSSSTELVQSRGGGLATSLSIGRESVDVNGYDSEAGNHKNRHASSVSCPSTATSNGNTVSKNVVPSNLLKADDDGLVVRESTATTKNGSVNEKLDIVPKKSSADVASRETGLTGVRAHAVSAGTVPVSLSAVMKGSQETNSTQVNGLRDPRGENESLKDSATVGGKGLDRESSHANNVEVDVDTKIDLHRVDKSDSNRIPMQCTSRVEGILNPTVGEMANTKSEEAAGDSTIIIMDQDSGLQCHTQSLKAENQDYGSTVELHNDRKCSETERKQQDDLDILQTDMKATSALADISDSSLCRKKSQAAAETSTSINSKNVLSGSGITAQHSLDNGSRMLDTFKEDSILEEARIIKDKRKRIAELSFGTIPVEVRTQSQWDFVLEEMAWLANDFAQERRWKMTAAMQICHRAAFTSQLKFEEQIQQRKLKSLASTLASAVLQFWNSVEVPRELEKTTLGTNKETVKELKCDAGKKCSASGVTEYARRLLKFVKSSSPHLQAAALSTPDNMCDPGILETSWDDRLTEASLFYSVPSGAIEAYRRSIESHLLWCEKSGSSLQEEVETSAYDPAEDTEYNGYYEDEEETSTYYLPGAIERSKSFKLAHKKKKNLMRYHSARSYDIGADLPFGTSYTGGSNALMGKRPASNLNVGSVPMKRMRTASRQRVVSSFGCGTVGSLPVPSKTDASSGDTSSFQDDQSSLKGGSVVQKGTEVESSGNFERQLPYDMAETSGNPKKKKGSAYEQAWHLDSMVRGEKDHWKKRPENHFNTNGLYGPHSVKKQKTGKQSVENNFHTAIPSPAASQMSNMSNPNKFIKFFGGRDRGRKIKGLKISSGQEGCENPWSLFEDQALVVLVHDMGPNWELISDAMNSTLKIKCIYRNPSECKERHKILMDRSGDDGADSAEDSGNSQSYPSTLPGIPKGSARQLFQRLQGPLEEDTLKSHFEMIFSIGKKFQHRKLQNDGWDPKQIVPVHNSQVMALSHVFPNNLNGSILTPLDLCDASTSGQEVFSLEPLLNQGTSVFPASEANPSITGSSGVVNGNNMSTIPGPTSASSRFNVPRGSLPLDEQHRNQQYNQMLSGRNLQQPILSTPGAVSGPDLGHRLPSGNAMSVNGINRSTPLSRPGLQGVSSLAVPNTGSMLSSGMGGISNTENISSVVNAPQGNSMLRPRGPIQHMMRVAKGNGQGIPALSSGFTNQTTPPVQAYPGHLSQQQKQQQQSHVLGNSHNTHLHNHNLAAGTQQQAFAIRQRQMHQRFLQQQKQQLQQFPASGAMTPHVQSQHQVPPVSPSPQNSPQTQPVAPSQPLSIPLSSTSPNMTATAQQQPQKPQLPVHGLGRNPQSGASVVNNQAGKQRQRQLQQQSGRQHPQQRQSTQGQQQNKLLKGMGRGNIMHQSVFVDPSHLNGSPMSQGIQGTEKEETTVQAVPGQPSKPVTAVSLYPQSKPLNSPQHSSTSQQQPKTYPVASSSQQHQQRQLHSENSIQGTKSVDVPGNILSTSSPSVTPAVAQPTHQHFLLHQKQGNQVQPTSHRTIHQNHGLPKMSQAEHSPRNPQSVTNTTQTASVGTTKGVPQAGNNSVSTAGVASPKELNLPSFETEQNGVAKVSSSITNLTGSDTVSKLAQELDLSPDVLLGHGHKGGTEGQQQQLQQSPSLVHKQPQLSEQLLVQNQKHIPSEQQQQPYLKTLELAAVHEKSSSRPPDS